MSGKITGDPGYKVKFLKAQRRLEASGNAVINPAMIPTHGFSWDACMRMTLAMLRECEVIYLLEGWEDSKGAVIEYKYALEHGIKVWRETW